MWVAAEEEGVDERSDSVCWWNRQLKMEQDERSLKEIEGVVRERRRTRREAWIGVHRREFRDRRDENSFK